MNEIYWLTRVGNIHEFGLVLTIIGLAALGLMAAMFPILREELEEANVSIKKVFKVVVIAALSGSLITTFVPSKQDLYAIYGIGSVVDYVKGNDKAKEIPDKVVDAIINFMDECSNGE